MIKRQRFRLSTSAGAAVTDTGNLSGELVQMHWHPDTLDTGQPCTLALSLLPSLTDTGAGFSVHSQAGVNLGAAVTEIVNPDDTGSLNVAYIIGANDRLRASVTPADTGVVVAGDLYVWSRDNS